MNKFPLLRRFSIISLVAMFVTAFVLILLFRQDQITKHNAISTDRNLEIAHQVTHTLETEISQLVSRSKGLDVQALHNNPDVDLLTAALNKLAAKDIVKIKIYNLSGVVIYSSATEEIGLSSHHPELLAKALAGETVHQVDNRESFLSRSGELHNVYISLVYMPLMHAGERTAVIEIYTDATPFFNRLQTDLIKIALVVLCVFAVLYGVLFFAVFKVDRAINRWKKIIYEQGESLGKSHRLLKAVMDGVPARIFWKDKNLRYLGCNSAFANDAGERSPQDVIGKDDYQMAWKEQAELYRADDRRVMETGIAKLSYEEPLTTPDGKTIWLNTSKVPLQNSTHETIGVLGVYQDVTEQKQAAEQLKEQVLRNRLMLQATQDGFLLVDLEGRLREVNETYCRMSGYTPDELLTMRVSDVEASENPAETQAHIRKVLETGFDCFETRHRRKDGSLLELEVSTALVGKDEGRLFFAFLRDIGERKKAEQKIQEQQARLTGLIDSAMDAIVSSDENQNITIFNHGAERVFGYNAADILGQPLEKLMPDRYHATHRQHVEEFGRTGITQRSLNMPRISYGLRANGEEFPFEATISKIEVAGKTTYTAIMRDITARKIAEAKIKRLTQLYAALSQCSQAIVHSASEAELFRTICLGAVQFGGMKMAWIGLLNETSGKVEPVTCYGSGIEYLDGIQVSVNPDEPAGRGPIGIVMRENHPYWCQDYLNEPLLALWREHGRRSGWRSSAALPLHRQGKVIGVFTLYSGEVNAFDEAERNLLAEMAMEVDFALEHFAMEAERKRAEDELRIAATAFDSHESLMITDANSVIIRVNQAFIDETGYTPDEIIGQTPRLLRSGRHDEDFYKAMWETIRSTGAWQGEVWDRRKNGEIYPKWLTISAVKGNDGVVTHYVGSHIDITERKAAENKIQHLAFFDPLTSLPNRRLLMDRLQQALASSARNNWQGALLFIDLDNFKTLNDTLGHDIGDLLLQQVAQRLETCVREGDTVARIGGDEFVVLLEDLSDQVIEAAEQTKAIGEKILAVLNQPYQLAAHKHYSTPSIGVTLFNGNQQATDELMKQADIAMYQAKKSGRNTLRFFDAQMQDAINTRASLEEELRQALEKQQFHLYYQIQVDGSQRPLGAEVLIRWMHPERGIVPPLQFIPLAEETGLILPIGLWVLETACAQIKVWEQDERTRDLVLAVNVSARQFGQANFVAQVQAVVQRHAIDPTRLKLELTESMLVENISDIIASMTALKKIGIQFSLDDFGTGYSSLQYLQKLPLDQLKIDQSFVRDMTVDVGDNAIVQTIIAMAKVLNLDIIAEGVETEEQHQRLHFLGCDHYQGYLFSKPVPIEQFEVLLKRS